MRKFFIGVMAAVAIVLSAFAIKPSKPVVKKDKQASLYWFVGSTYTGRQNTKANEITPSGCSDSGSVHCEDGYDDDDLNTSGNPFSGLKSGADINEWIRKS